MAENLSCGKAKHIHPDSLIFMCIRRSQFIEMKTKQQQERSSPQPSRDQMCSSQLNSSTPLSIQTDL